VVALTDENDDDLEPMEAGPDSVVRFFFYETLAWLCLLIILRSSIMQFTKSRG
jgi:hypothetical protein